MPSGRDRCAWTAVAACLACQRLKASSISRQSCLWHVARREPAFADTETATAADAGGRRARAGSNVSSLVSRKRVPYHIAKSAVNCVYPKEWNLTHEDDFDHCCRAWCPSPCSRCCWVAHPGANTPRAHGRLHPRRDCPVFACPGHHGFRPQLLQKIGHHSRGEVLTERRAGRSAQSLAG
jgi:hypothetical protein